MSSMESRNSPGSRAQSVTRKFNGVEKTSRQWNCIRKDQDLWDEDADCLVHFHAKGLSQRPPSLKVSFTAIENSQCSYLLEDCLTARRGSNFSHNSDASSSQQPTVYDLFILAPAQLSREQAYTYHVTTRNFIALLTNQALVGEKLGSALVDLWQRMKEWQPTENATAKLLSYCDLQGYSSLAENVTYATATLNFAEKAHVQELWTNAFVHCAGMHDRLDRSPDYQELSYITKALVTRASLEMDLHMSRATRAIGCFLEEDLGTDRLGLTKPARNHLDRFRGFLHSHYMEQLGYFPPTSSDPYSKRMWSNMHDDFESLYELLADTTTDRSMQNDFNASGGICCLQNTQAFDLRHGCDALQHPCPLLPDVNPRRQSIDTQKTLRSLRLGRAASVSEVGLPPRRALADATNAISTEATNRPIVIEYRRFERLRPEEKVTVPEARKVRWLLVYATLQMLKSITRAPKGVRDVEAASYPLCVLTTGSPEWHDDENEDSTIEGSTTESILDLELTTPLPLTPGEDEVRPDSEGRISIHPDCEADSAADYFSNSRRSSINALDMTPQPLRIVRPTRTASIRTSVSSGVGVLQRSFSMARRNSSRKSVQPQKGRRMTSYEVVAPGYASSPERKESSPTQALDDVEGNVRESPVQSNMGTLHNPWQEFDFGLQNVAEEPILHDHHFDSGFGLHLLDTSAARLESDAGNSFDLGRLEEADENVPGITNRNSWLVGEAAFTTSPWPNFDEPTSATTYSSEPSSLRSSYMADDCDTPVSIYSSPSGSLSSSHRASVDFDNNKKPPALQLQTSARPQHISLMDVKQSLNAGCYSPSGAPGNSSPFAPALSRFSSARTRTTSSTSMSTMGGRGKRGESVSSPVYELANEQADDDREASNVRGRRLTRNSSVLAGISFDD